MDIHVELADALLAEDRVMTFSKQFHDNRKQVPQSTRGQR